MEVAVCAEWSSRPPLQSLQRRSQLWRMTAGGQVVHIASSTHSGSDQVLDIAGVLPAGHFTEEHQLPLVVSRRSGRPSVTQGWQFNKVVIRCDCSPLTAVAPLPSPERSSGAG